MKMIQIIIGFILLLLSGSFDAQVLEKKSIDLETLIVKKLIVGHWVLESNMLNDKALIYSRKQKTVNFGYYLNIKA